MAMDKKYVSQSQPIGRRYGYNGRPQIIALVTVESLPKDSVDMSP